MRVAILTTSYPSHEGDPSGHFVRAEALRLSAEGHEVHVIAPSPTGPPRDGDHGIHVWGQPHAGAFGWPGAAVRIRQAPWRAVGAAAFAHHASRRLAALRPERLVAHWLVPSGFPIAASVPFPAQLECVAHGADVRLLCRLPATLRDRIVRAILARASSLRFVADSLLRALLQALSSPLRARVERVAVVAPCALLVPDVAARAATLRRENARSIVMTSVGRLVPAKRVDLAVRAANLLGADAMLCVVGDGPERSRLHRLDRVGNVRFAGAMHRHEALAWVAASSCLVHASQAEAAPTVVREARLLNVPVVACAAGDIARWAGTDPGIVMADPSPDAIASAVGSVCSLSSP